LQAEGARQREQRTAALYALSRELAAVQTVHEIVETVDRHASMAFGAPAAILLPDDKRRLSVHPVLDGGLTVSEKDRGVAQWAFDHGQRAGHGTNTLPGAEALYVPLAVSSGVVGILGVGGAGARRLLEPDQAHLVDAFAGQAAVALERANLAAEAEHVRLQVQSERLQNSLLSAVSHDLRTPLAAIAGASSTLLETGENLDKPLRRELLHSISDEAESLNQLVGKLLDMTRLEAGALVVHREWHSVEEIIGAVLNRLSRRLEGRPVATHLAPDLPLVLVDELLVQQVLVNLLENADRHTPPGSPIEVSAAAVDKWLIIEVADRGPGLQPGDEARVFEKFYRAPQGHSRLGVGLGLSICKGLVQLHGGRIWAENREGGGAVFRFALPLEDQPPAIGPEEGLVPESEPSEASCPVSPPR
jgi:two-component system sensor histidine kinase KdpD